MGEKKPTLRYLTQGAENARRAGIREPLGLLAVPSLEERARLFLRAIRGEREFTSSEQAEAHDTILNAMAADIAAKSNSAMPDEPPLRPTGPIVEPTHGPVPTVAMSPVLLEVDEPMFPDKEDSPRRPSSAFEERQAPQRAPPRQKYAAQLARTQQEARPSRSVVHAFASMPVRPALTARISDLSPPFPAPAHKPPKRRVFIWGAALSVFAGLCVLGGLALYQMATRSASVTAQSAPGDFRARFGSDAQVGFPSTALGVMPAPKNIERSRADLIERARTVIAAGDIEAVRVALSRMVESGKASAAVDLGSTYDPNILDALGVRNFPADVAKARAWYQKAQQMGASEAVGLLQSLESSERRSR